MCTLTLSMHDVQDKKHSELYLGRMRLLRKSRGVLRSCVLISFFFFSSRRRHTRYWRDWSSDVCSSDLDVATGANHAGKNARRLATRRKNQLTREQAERESEAELNWERKASLRRRSKARSEERRVGKECRSRWSPYH